MNYWQTPLNLFNGTGKSGESKKFELTRQWALTADLRPVEIWSRDQVQLRM
jgi:hypothetical protein